MPLTVGEGMTGSRSPAALRHRTRNLDTLRHARPVQSTHHRSDTDPDPDRLTEHASPDVDVKATPLRGRPFGPRLDPDAATTRPPPGDHAKKKGQPARPHGLTGPTPSGMTWHFLVAGAGVAGAGFEPATSGL